MSIDKPVVWVAFVTINIGDHDEFSDFLSIHATREGAKKAVADWVKGPDDASDVVWVNDANTDEAYLVGKSTATFYRVAAGEAEVFGAIAPHELES